MEEERDLVTFTDEDGSEFELEVIDYFDYEDESYAVLLDPAEDCEEEVEVYIMKVETDGEYENFLPPDDDKMEVLCAIVEKRMAEEGCECGDECDCGDGCDCGEHECNCGCHPKE